MGVIRGLMGADDLWATDEPTYLYGLGGADTLRGGAGADHIYGDGEDSGIDLGDLLFGGAGHDYIQGNKGADTIDGGIGNDRLNGGADNDTITGGEGYDYINGNKGADTIDGGEGNDTLRGGQDDDLLMGGSGNDMLMGDKGNDVLIGGLGLDTLTGGEGADIFRFALTPAGTDAPAIFDSRTVTATPNAPTELILDFENGVDKIDLPFTVQTILTMNDANFDFRESPWAATAGSTLVVSAPGDHEVGVTLAGDTVYLSFSMTGGNLVDSIIGIRGVAVSDIDVSDFI